MSKSELLKIKNEFQLQVEKYLNDGDRVVAGISGGPDSMLLLYLLHRSGVKTVAVHCNYGLRGKASDLDQELVEQICSMWEIECVSVRFDPEEAGKENFQEWARQRRYQVFYDLKREYKADYITTAHHKDDQIETILQKILRGAGTASWRGMEILEGDLFRPLLGISKQQIIQFVQEFNIPFRIDGSNEESTYARNFLRHSWFPELDRLFPGWKKNLLKIPGRASEFESMSDHILSGVSEHPERLIRNAFLALPDVVKPVILHRFIEKSGVDEMPGGSFFSSVASLEQLQSGKSLQLSNQLHLERDRDEFILVKKKRDSEKEQINTFDKFTGEIESDNLILSTEPFHGEYQQGVLHLDSEKVSFPITLREWQNGDEIIPLGMDGSQLISDHLTNRKISSSKKSEAKVLESFDGTICAVIFPHFSADNQLGTVSEKVRCTNQTKTVLTIRKK
ncbi:MAG: tRNA lysidine(34) synthetase TilS [Balneolaceae bacterium]|nr:MAG: tRNA lysidine(34) synthetase TilS [Balneolaceae bacterium]